MELSFRSGSVLGFGQPPFSLLIHNIFEKLSITVSVARRNDESGARRSDSDVGLRMGASMESIANVRGVL
jgi:hypothetical protein